MITTAERPTSVKFENVSISYHTRGGELRAVEGVNLEVFRGEIIGIVGESGCGKTTLGLTLLNLLPAAGRLTSGRIRVGDVDVESLEGERLRRYRWEKVAMVFQSAMNALDPVKTIESQMMETILQHKRITKDESRTLVRRLMQLVSLPPSRLSSYPHQLSGGMKQRVVIAMALCLSPEVLVADEPTTALDVVVQANILRMMKQLKESLGLTVILISHDVSIMWEMCDRLAVMYAGKLVEVGPAHEVMTHPMHPYTEALIKAVPVVGAQQQEIRGIPGSPPNLLHPPTGCRFKSRCMYAFEKCNAEPSLSRPKGATASSEARLAACWLRA